MKYIVLAEDYEVDRSYFSYALKELYTSFELATASDGCMLIELLESATEIPERIFLDLGMPSKSKNKKPSIQPGIINID